MASNSDSKVEMVPNNNDDAGSSSSDESFYGFDEGDINFESLVLREIDMNQAENDRESPIDLEYGWSREDSPPILSPFIGNPGLKVDLPPNPTPLDFFNILFDDEMWDTLVMNTNIYAERRTQGRELSNFSRLKKWTPVNRDEMKVFISLVLAMGIVRKPDVVDYWSKEKSTETPFFGKRMSKDRFLIILSNLHLVDNQEANDDRLFKLRPFITMLKTNFDKYEPEQRLALDEATCPFKGRVIFRVYNPAKPNKWGIKLYQVCESSSGYCVTFDIHDGTPGCAAYSELVGTDVDSGQTTKIVTGLLARGGMLNKGHIVFLDNYYNSPELADELNAHDTYMCGTVRVNRRNMPKAFSQVKLTPGNSVFRRKDNTLVIKFHEKRDVHMISTYHEARVAVLDKSDRNGNLISKPVCVIDYCKNMGGVDLSDQILQYYEPLRRSLKWWRKLFFHLLNLQVVNAYKLYLRYGNPPSKRSHQKFRSQLVQALVESAPMAPVPKIRGGRTPEPICRLLGRHFPQYIPAKAGAKRAHPQRDCVACNVAPKERVGKKRKQTIYKCDTCDVALCLPDCFRVYHSVQNYKRQLQNTDADSD